MSWKALDRATESDIRSPTTKFVLHLLANKADEDFSCYPSIRTLMAESGAGRSTVMRALKELEAKGFITRRSQFHDSGAQRSTRYYLNHPQAPHPDPRPDLGRGGPKSGRPPSHPGTGTVPERDPTGVPNRDPLNPPIEPPTEPAAVAKSVLAALPEPWRVGSKDADILIPAIEDALASGWTLQNLIPHISQNPGGVRNPARVLARRLADLPHPPARSCLPTIAWCGECEDERSRTITIDMPDGTEAAAFCPRCSPQAQRKTRDSYPYLKEVNSNGRQRL
jgi:Helix-turn-helix domain